LQLDEKPNLPPGRVTVVLRQEPPPAHPTEDWFQCLQRIRAEREAAGYPFMNEAEMEAYLSWLREDDDRIERIYQEMEQEKRRQENG
jgi:hypothetical protein